MYRRVGVALPAGEEGTNSSPLRPTPNPSRGEGSLVTFGDTVMLWDIVWLIVCFIIFNIVSKAIYIPFLWGWIRDIISKAICIPLPWGGVRGGSQ